jgi:uncharacterized membrane protein
VTRPRRNSLLHRLFDVGVGLKGIDGVLEVIGGLVFLIARPETLTALVRFLTAHEISEDPSDLIANALRTGMQHLVANTKVFAGAYLLGHGLVKIVLVAGLLRGARWSYPTALWFLGCFVAYQTYRIALTHSLGLVVLTVFDLAVMYLIWREYRLWKGARRGDAEPDDG